MAQLRAPAYASAPWALGPSAAGGAGPGHGLDLGEADVALLRRQNRRLQRAIASLSPPRRAAAPAGAAWPGVLAGHASYGSGGSGASLRRLLDSCGAPQVHTGASGGLLLSAEDEELISSALRTACRRPHSPPAHACGSPCPACSGCRCAAACAAGRGGAAALLTGSPCSAWPCGGACGSLCRCAALSPAPCFGWCGGAGAAPPACCGAQGGGGGGASSCLCEALAGRQQAVISALRQARWAWGGVPDVGCA